MQLKAIQLGKKYLDKFTFPKIGKELTKIGKVLIFIMLYCYLSKLILVLLPDGDVFQPTF